MNAEEVIEVLAGFSLFADLSRPELQGVSHTFEEESFAEGQRILRQGFSGSGFYVILQGEAAVVIDGAERSRIGRGDFFGEISILLDEPPTADVIAMTPLACLVLPRDRLTTLLTNLPAIAIRMLQTEIRRLHLANRWRN